MLALAAAGCARHRGAAQSAAPSQTASLLPADIAIGFLAQINSQPARTTLTGESTVPACRFTEKGMWSAGGYRKLTGQHGPAQATPYAGWTLARVENAQGREITSADLNQSGVLWYYDLRTPRTARTAFSVSDHCNLGPSGDAPQRIVEALSALGVEVPASYGFLSR
ncbi:MAG TPA: hypothetical protein VFJ70_06405 [Burkholderiales bacterium]|nr:hypothetical protein [Burkholderiales bacterium]